MAPALTAILIWVVAALTLWLHALLGITGNYLGQGYPITPGLKVTFSSLTIDAALATLPILGAAALSCRFRLRWLALPILALLWLLSLATLIDPFKIDFGTTWSGAEPLIELALHPWHTPLALILLLAAAWRLMRRPDPAAT